MADDMDSAPRLACSVWSVPHRVPHAMSHPRSCAGLFRNAQGSMNFASNIGPLASTIPSSVTATIAGSCQT
jgi:hypothetical protein